MEFLNPSYFWTLLLVPVVIGLYLLLAYRRRQGFKAFGDAALVARLTEAVSSRKRRWKAAIYALAFLCLVVALIGPRFGTKLKEVKREGIDMVIALDVSNSMLAQDVAPSRLKRAKFEITKLLDKLSGDRVGLVIFGGDAFVQCPLTLDYSALKLFLDITDTSQMPIQGTDFNRAVDVGIKAFQIKGTDKDSKNKRSRVLLVVSDGEQTGQELQDLRDKASDEGITLFAAGVGETEGVPIPLPEGGFKYDRNGAQVSTKLEETSLKDLAKNGAYFRITRTASNLTDLPDDLANMEKSKFSAAKFAQYEERFQIPLAIGLFLLVGEWLISEKRKRKGMGRVRE
jgi:Ca-activated chloride channel family protein